MLSRTAVAVARRAAASGAARRTFVTSAARLSTEQAKPTPYKYKTLSEVKTSEDLIGPGAEPGTVPTDLEQSTGLERLEILGKMEGIDVFDMKIQDASFKGTLEKPMMVKSAGEEQYLGCTGWPKDSHEVIWLGMDRKRPVERCPECGSVYKMEYIGKEDDGHHDHHDHHHDPALEEPKTFADFVSPKYY